MNLMTIAPLSLFFVRDKWDESFRSGHLILTPLLANLPYDLDYLGNKGLWLITNSLIILLLNLHMFDNSSQFYV